MALRVNATLVFSSYAVHDGDIEFRFVCPDPGPGEPSEYTVTATDTELSTVNTAAQLRTLLTTKLQRKWRQSGIASKLDTFLGQSITI